METVTKRLYEALFLVDSGEAAADWEGINEHIKKILDRGDAEIVSMRKWDDRPLAYEINGKRRGTYILVYFNCLPEKITPMERDAQLSERISRVLILRGDHITQEDMDKETPASMMERQGAEQRDRENAAAAEEEVVEEVIDEEDVSEEQEEIV